MAFLTIDGTEYLVTVPDAAPRRVAFEYRSRTVTSALHIDRRGLKEEFSVTVMGTPPGTEFTAAAADAFEALLQADQPRVYGGDVLGGRTITGRARDTQRIPLEERTGFLTVHVSFSVDEV